MLQHNQQEELINVIIDSFDKDIENTLAFVEKTLNDILLEYGVNERTALDFQILFQDALTRAGYYDKVNDLIDNKFDEIYKLIKEGFREGNLAITYTADDLSKISALKEIQLNQFNSLVSEASTSIQKSLYKYTLSNASLTDIVDQLKLDFKDTPLYKYSTTLAQTAIGDFQQSVIDLKAQDLDEEDFVWVYEGDIDDKTRDFCKCILSQKNYYNDSQKNQLQRAPQRKYNCRHRLRPMSFEKAIRLNYTPTEKIDCGL